MAAELSVIIKNAGESAEGLARAVLGVRVIFGRDLPENPVFVLGVTHALQRLSSKGVGAALSALVSARGQ
jgi:fructuronate reductase